MTGPIRALDPTDRPCGRSVATRRRVALVTGSSRGLGSTIAARLARDGLAVAVNDLRGDGRAREVARAIRAGGGIAGAFTADVTDEQRGRRARRRGGRWPRPDRRARAKRHRPAARSAGRRGGVGGPPRPARLLRQEPRSARPRRAARDARAPPWADRPDRLRGRRSATTGPVRLRHRQARADRTDPQLGARARAPRHHRQHGRTGLHPRRAPRNVPDANRHAYLASVPAGRMGTRDDIANAVSFFASRAASFITGQRLVVDGGRSLHD